MSQINLLTLEILLDINEQIKIRASKDHRIEYSGSEDYSIKMHELKKLIEYTPKNRAILEIAAYYLKNIILLQAFPDANHRTALTALEIFLEDNNLNFDYTPVEAFDFRKELPEIHQGTCQMNQLNSIKTSYLRSRIRFIAFNSNFLSIFLFFDTTDSVFFF